MRYQPGASYGSRPTGDDLKRAQICRAIERLMDRTQVVEINIDLFGRRFNASTQNVVDAIGIGETCGQWHIERAGNGRVTLRRGGAL